MAETWPRAARHGFLLKGKQQAPTLSGTEHVGTSPGWPHHATAYHPSSTT